MAGQRKSSTLVDRILAKCNRIPNGCLQWSGYSLGGYGRIRWQGKRLAVHRAAYELQVGPVGDLCVCHTCDNPLCVNPDHLFLGTRADNNMDKVHKGRQAKGPAHGVHGEHSHFAKLTPDQVRQIRAMEGRWPQRVIASQFNVSQSQISNIINNRTWRNHG